MEWFFGLLASLDTPLIQLSYQNIHKDDNKSLLNSEVLGALIFAIVDQWAQMLD